MRTNSVTGYTEFLRSELGNSFSELELNRRSYHRWGRPKPGYNYKTTADIDKKFKDMLRRAVYNGLIARKEVHGKRHRFEYYAVDKRIGVPFMTQVKQYINNDKRAFYDKHEDGGMRIKLPNLHPVPEFSLKYIKKLAPKHIVRVENWVSAHSTYPPGCNGIVIYLNCYASELKEQPDGTYASPLLSYSYDEMKDPFAELKAALAEGKTIQIMMDGWENMNHAPKWDCPISSYRIKPDSIDPYAKLKAALAEGKMIEFLAARFGCVPPRWHSVNAPAFDHPVELYRIIPDQSDPYAKLKVALAEGQTIQFKTLNGSWYDANPAIGFLFPVDRYRIKPKPDPIDPYAKLKAALADGKELEYNPGRGEWYRIGAPAFDHPVDQYRIKPIDIHEDLPMTESDTIDEIMRLVKLLPAGTQIYLRVPYEEVTRTIKHKIYSFGR